MTPRTTADTGIREMVNAQISAQHDSVLAFSALHQRFYAALLVVWGLWVVVFTPFEAMAVHTSMVTTSKAPGIGAVYAVCGVLLWLVAQRGENRLVRLSIASFAHAILWGAVCAVFIAGNPKSTAVPVYGALAIGHLFSFWQLLAWRQVYGWMTRAYTRSWVRS